MKYNAGIIGLGTKFPTRKVSNKELERILPTSDEWIKEKTGISHRRFIKSDKSLSDLCIPAAKKALKNARVSAKDIDVIIVGAMSHDYISSVLTGNIIKKAIKADKAYAIDLSIICAGFIYCSEVAAALIESGKAEKVLIVNGEVFSKYPHSRVTSVIFGDGAGAAVLGKVKKGKGIISSYIDSSSDGAENLGIFVGGSKKVFCEEVARSGEYMIHMNGRPLFDFAVRSFSQSINAALKKARLKLKDIDIVISHQANINIIKEGMRTLGLPMSKTYTNIHKYGNIGGGSVTTALYEAEQKGIIQPGSIVVCVAFGSGLAWGANIMKWCGKQDKIKLG